MNHIPIPEVIIRDDRIRREFDESALNELAHDIAKPHGLLHAPILRDDEQTLVVGERRIRAMALLHKADKPFTHQGQCVPPGMIPYQTLSELSSIELFEAELSENVVRDDLTWQEKVRAYADLDDLRSITHPEHTAVDTAREILGREPDGREPTELVSDSIALVTHLDDPEIGRAKTKAEAMKKLNRKLEKEFSAMLAERGIQAADAQQHTLLYGKLEGHMRGLGDKGERFDLILADPPYGINADKVFGDMADLDHEYSDDPKEAIQRYEYIATKGFELAKDEAHIYLFCDPLWFHTLFDMLTRVGWWCAKAPIIWDKGNMGLLPYPEHMPRRCYETILFAIKGERPAFAVHRDIISVPNIANKSHAAQKPVELFAQLIRRSCRPGDTVLDPCCGSGTIFPAATRESVIATGIEKELDSYNLAYVRMGEKE